MLLMIEFSGLPGTHEESVKKFKADGYQLPPDVKLLGRWHEVGTANGWMLVETTNLNSVHGAAYANHKLMKFTVKPVIEDPEAKAAL